MGSLMAGWDSQVTKAGQETFRRNKSLTKEEIEAFWKSKQLLQQEHLRAILASLGNTEVEESKDGAEDNKRKRLMDLESETDLEKLKQNGWWTKSNWAFLNEPPVTERSGGNYVSQFHVANMAASKLGIGEDVGA